MAPSMPPPPPRYLIGSAASLHLPSVRNRLPLRCDGNIHSIFKTRSSKTESDLPRAVGHLLRSNHPCPHRQTLRLCVHRIHRQQQLQLHAFSHIRRSSSLSVTE